jgi:CHAD domain-containing protein
MAFRLRPDESATHGFRRLARKELTSAVGDLHKHRPSRDEAIHEARTSVKKVRAILQLIDDDHGNGLGRSERQLRSVNRTLSVLRDADALMETLSGLRSRHPQLFGARALADVRRRFLARKRDAVKELNRTDAWSAADSKLRSVRRHVKRWQPSHGGSGAMTRGIRAAHQRGRDAMKCAEKQQQAAEFHEWRKAMKALWYALRLVEQSDAAIRRDVRALHRAETLLGDDHNLVVLCDEISKAATICRGPIDLDRVRLAADRDQCRMREQALDRVRYIYDRQSGAYARAVARAWRKARTTEDTE